MADAVITPIIGKWGKLCFWQTCGPVAGTSGNYPVAPVTAVSGTPTLYRGGSPIQAGPIVWADAAHDDASPCCLLGCGGVDWIQMADGGERYSDAAVATVSGGTLGPDAIPCRLGTPLAASGLGDWTIAGDPGGWGLPPVVTVTGDGTGAAAHAIVWEGQVVSCEIDAPGSGYTAATVTFSGGTSGSGATGTVVLSGGGVARIAMKNRGSGYAGGPSISVSPPPGYAGPDTGVVPSTTSRAQGTVLIPAILAVVNDATTATPGTVRAIVPVAPGRMDSRGSGYDATQPITVSAGTGWGCVLTPTFGPGGAITGLAVSNVTTSVFPGSYAGTPAINVYHPTGTGASISLVTTNGAAWYTQIHQQGSGYDAGGLVFCIASPGSTAMFRPTVTRYIYAIPVVEPGDYLTPPTIAISDATGSGAVAAPVMSGALRRTAATTTSGSASITITGTTTRLAAGQRVFGQGIPDGTTIASVAGTAVTLSGPASRTGSTPIHHAPADVYTYDAPANWLTPTLAGTSYTVPTATGAAVANAAGATEPATGTVRTFGATPAFLPGVNIGSFMLGTGYGRFTGLNRLHGGYPWKTDTGGGIAYESNQVTPVSWTAGDRLSRWIDGPGFGGANTVDGMGYTQAPGPWTLQYDDPSVNTAGALWGNLTVSSRATATPRNASGPNAGTSTPVTLAAQDVTRTGGAITALGVANSTLGSGWQGALVTVTGGGGSGAMFVPLIAGGVITGFQAVAGGTGYTSTPTVQVWGASVAGTTWRLVYDLAFAAGITNWQIVVGVGFAGGTVANGISTWPAGSLGATHLWVTAPDVATGLPQDPTPGDPYGADGNTLRALRGIRCVRGMDATQGGGFGNAVLPIDLDELPSDAWGQCANTSFRFGTVRVFNTDPSKGSVASGGDGTYGWPASTKFYAPQGWAGLSGDPPTTVTGTTTAGSPVVTGLSSVALMAASTVSGAGIPATDPNGLTPHIAALDVAGSSLTLSCAATASGTVTLTVANPPYAALPPADMGLAMVYDGTTVTPERSVVYELVSATPHGMVSGRSGGSAWVDQTAGVAIAISGGGQFRPNNQSAVVWVTGPYTVAIASYIGTGSGAAPQRPASATPIDLTAGGTVTGWGVFFWTPENTSAETAQGNVHYGLGGGIPYEHLARACAQAGAECWVNIPMWAGRALCREIGRRVAGQSPPSVVLELNDEPWNSGFSTYFQYPYIERLLTVQPAGTVLMGGRYTADGAALADLQYGPYVLMSGWMADEFKAGFALGGGDPAKVEVALGTFWAGPAKTASILGIAQQYGCPADRIAPGPYLQLDAAQMTFDAAYAPIGSIVDGAGGWCCAAQNDHYRYHIAFHGGVQADFLGHSQPCAAWGQPVAPIVTNFNAQMSATCAGGAVTALTIVDPGVGYPADSQVPLAITGGNQNAAGYATTGPDGKVNGYQITAPGTGYSTSIVEVLGGHLGGANYKVAYTYVDAAGDETTAGNSESTYVVGVYTNQSFTANLPPIPAWASAVKFYTYANPASGWQWYNLATLTRQQYGAAGGRGARYAFFGPLGSPQAPPSTNAASASAGTAPVVYCYEGGMTMPVTSGAAQRIPLYNGLIHDRLAHPSYADVTYAWAAICQAGEQSTAGSGAAGGCYYQLTQYPAGNNLWMLRTTAYQPPGDGHNNRFCTPQGGPDFDGHDHNGGTYTP